MIFGPRPTATAEGLILAHGFSAGGKRFRKGQRLDANDIKQLQHSGVDEVTVVLLEEGDIAEDSAAAKIAAALCASGLRMGSSATGRCNLYATTAGLLRFDEAMLHELNGLDERLTIATLRPDSRVEPGQMIATIKIIPFAVPAALLDEAARCAPLLSVAPFKTQPVSLIQTRLPDTRQSVLEKTARTTAARAASLGCAMMDLGSTAHDVTALAAALADTATDLILVIGATAIADRADVIPAAIQAAGGQIIRMGMPVDPGNLLCLGAIGGQTIIGLPGCARSPKRNGFDLVLERLVAGLPVGSDTIAAMGVGGLLDDVSERALPRAEIDGGSAKPVFGALLLAAGASRRMGADNKLLLEAGGKPLVRRAAETLASVGMEGLITVLGHEAQAVGEALGAAGGQMIFNPDHASGMATSLRAGLAAAPAHWDAVLVMLADMPFVTQATVNKLLAAYRPDAGQDIIVPRVSGQRGNPVIWGRVHWPALMALTGDAGARRLIDGGGDRVSFIDLDDAGCLQDIDDPAQWQAAQSIF